MIENDSILLENGHELILTTNKCIGNLEKYLLPILILLRMLVKEKGILLDDGKLLLRVISSNNVDTVRTVVEHGGVLSSRKVLIYPVQKFRFPVFLQRI